MGVKAEIDGEDLMTVLEVIEILGKKGTFTNLTLDDMKKIGEAIIILEDLKGTVELNIEREKSAQAQIPATPQASPQQVQPVTPVQHAPVQPNKGPMVQAPPQSGPKPPPPKQEKQAPLVGKEPQKESVTTATAGSSPGTTGPAKVAEEKHQEPEIPANAELRCETCKVIITPQQAKLSRLLTNKDLCKKCMDAGSKGAT